MTVAPIRPKYDLSRAEHDYPHRAGPPVRTMLLCSHPRSGSTLLAEAMYFAGELGCPLEYFHASFRPDFAARWKAATVDELRAAVWRKRTDPGGTLGVKLFWRDVADIAAEVDPTRFAGFAHVAPTAVSPDAYRALADILAGLFPNAEYLYLERADRLRQAVSGVTATRTGVWRDLGDAGGASEVPYDFAAISALIANSAFSHAHWRGFFAANGIAPYTVTYETLIADYPAAVGALLDRLGRSGPVPAIRMRRQANAETAATMARYLRDQQALKRD